MQTKNLYQKAQKIYNSYFTAMNNKNLHEILIYIFEEDELKHLLLKSSRREICNNLITRNYINETVVKSAFVKKVLKKDTHGISIFEFPILNSRIDLCKVNGKSIAYEIKTDYDNCKRLNKQLTDYSFAFEEIYVICSLNKIIEIENTIDISYGIYIYTVMKNKSLKFQLYRSSNLQNKISSSVQLSLLRIDEINKAFNQSDKNYDRNNKCEKILNIYSDEEINEIFKLILKKRFKNKWDFILKNEHILFDIDLQWFYRTKTNPSLVYK